MELGEPRPIEIKLAQGPVFGENNIVIQNFPAAPTEIPAPVAPFPPAQFVGRGKALAELIAGLGVEGGPGVLAVWGVAGVGKSALASAAASSLHDRFTDGCLWCDLRQAGGDRRVALDSIALALGQDPQQFPTPDSLSQRVRSVLSKRKLLMVLDNVSSADEIERLVDLTNPANTPVVITTRSRQVAMERADQSLEIGPLALEDSRKLLREVSRLPLNAVQDQLAELTGGIPLLIQAVGRQIRRARPQQRDATLADLVGRMTSPEFRLSLLEGDVPYHEVLLLSYESLGPAAKEVLKLMGVLGTRPVQMKMIGKILNLGEEVMADATEGLIDLALAVEEQTGHLRLSEDLHALARQLAEDGGEGPTFRTRAAEYLRSWLEGEAGAASSTDYADGLEHYLVLMEDCLARGDWDGLQDLTGLSMRTIHVAGQVGMVYNTRWPLATIDVTLEDRCYLDRADWIGMWGGDLFVSGGWIREWRLAGARMGDLIARESTLSNIDMRGIRAGDLVFRECNLESLDLRGARFGELELRSSRATRILLDGARCGDIVIRNSVVSDSDFTKARCGRLTSTGDGYLIDCRFVLDEAEDADPDLADDGESYAVVE